MRSQEERAMIVFGHVIFWDLAQPPILCLRVLDLQRVEGGLNTIFCVFVFGTQNEDTKECVREMRDGGRTMRDARKTFGCVRGRIQNGRPVTRDLTANKNADARWQGNFCLESSQETRNVASDHASYYMSYFQLFKHFYTTTY
jgi:hypothetical protein